MRETRTDFGASVVPLFGLTERDAAERAIMLEFPQPTIHAAPEFVLDLSGRMLPPCGMWGVPRENHGTALLEVDDALLVGSNLVVRRDGEWHCESMLHRDHVVAFYGSPTFDAVYPGKKPGIRVLGAEAVLNLSEMTPEDYLYLDEPVLLATAGEPDNWGRWIVQVLPKLVHFARTYQAGPLLCRMDKPWQWKIAAHLGIPPDAIVPHDPGRSYRCAQVSLLQHTSADGTVSTQEHALFQGLADAACRDGAPGHERIFVSRLGASRRQPDYRALRDEEALIAALQSLGFVAIEPETLSLTEQIQAFARARVVIGLGGAGMFNVAFCRPGTKLVTIEATDHFILGHSGIFSSLGLRYGVIYGCAERTAENADNPHAPWTLDVARAVAAIRDFI